MNSRRLPSFVALIVIALTLAFSAPGAGIAMAGAGAGCDLGNQGSHHGGLTDREVNQWETMAYAEMYGSKFIFDPCTNPILNDHGGVSEWVALEYPGYANSIVQVGMIKCNQVNGSNPPSWDACSSAHVGTLNYFYAYGHDDATSCGWGTHLPEPVFLGVVPSPSAWHTFKVQYKSATDRVWFLIDGTLVANIDAGAMCWINSPSSIAGYYTERWDTQDGATNLHLRAMRYEINDDGVTRATNFTSTSACNLDGEFSCARISGDHFTFSMN